jgi:hypothetical protein
MPSTQRYTLRCVATGEDRTGEDAFDLELTFHGALYNWLDGSWSGDSNRARDFARAGGEPDPGIGGCGAYELVRLEVNGKVIYEHGKTRCPNCDKESMRRAVLGDGADPDLCECDPCPLEYPQ